MNEIAAWLDQHHINFLTVGTTVVILIVALLFILMASRALRGWLTYLQARLHLSDDTTIMIARLGTSILWLVTALLVLNFWGVSVTGLWTLLLSTATIIGVGFLATWAMISNFTASFFLTLWRPFRLGQTVEILPENLKGRVMDRNLMFTTLREEGGSVLQVPNNIFFQKLFRVSEQGDAATPLFETREGAHIASLAPR